MASEIGGLEREIEGVGGVGFVEDENVAGFPGLVKEPSAA
jgi:hypothetical protein